MKVWMKRVIIPTDIIPKKEDSGREKDRSIDTIIYQSVFFWPVSSRVMIMVPGPKVFHAVQL